MTLASLAYEVDGFVFGRGTNVNVEEVTFGDTPIDTADQRNPRGDVMMFGKDRLAGRLISFKINITTAAGVAAQDLAAQMESVWRNPKVRLVPGAMSTLKMNRGRPRNVYGRGRRMSDISKWSGHGWIPITCDFQTVDDQYYDPDPVSIQVPLVSAVSGGILYPVQYPYQILGGLPAQTGAITVAGTAGAWPVFVIHGPIINPGISVIGAWTISLETTIQQGQTITIDTRPWSRSVYSETGANLAGLLRTDRKLSEITLDPGNHQILFVGQSVSGTAYLDVSAYQAHKKY